MNDIRTEAPRWLSDRERNGAEALGEAMHELNADLGDSMGWMLAAFGTGILLMVLGGAWDYWFPMMLGGVCVGMSVGTVGAKSQAVEMLENRKRALEGKE